MGCKGAADLEVKSPVMIKGRKRIKYMEDTADEETEYYAGGDAGSR